MFGLIPCVRALADLAGGVELTVHYNYMLDDCPAWWVVVVAWMTVLPGG